MTRAFKVNISAPSIIKDGGTSSQFLKADGSVDSSTYLITTTAASTYLSISTASSTYAPLSTPQLLTPFLKRVDSTNEGGQIEFARSVDNASAWYIDVYGNTTTPNFRIVDATSASVRLQIDGTTGKLSAEGFVKNGGTSAQYLMADGSVSTGGGSLSTLTIGTGLSGTSYNGSSAVTIANTGVLSINGSTGAITNVTKTDVANTFTTIQTITPATSVTGLSINAAASSIGLIVKANATTPGNLHEWQDSSGTAILSVSSTADLISSGNRSARFSYFQNVGGTGAYLDYAIVSNSATIIQRVTTAVGLIIRGAASQTAALQQWQDSAGTLVGAMQIDGNFKAQYFDSPASSGSYMQTSASNGLQIINRSASHIPLRIRGFTSQSSNLQEWQNSSQTALRYINSSGAEYVNSSVISSFDMYSESGSNNTMIAIPNDIWADKLRFRTGTYEYSADGSTSWTAGTFQREVIDGRNDSGVSLATTNKGHRWVWNSADIAWSTPKFVRLTFSYTSPVTTYDVTVEASSDGTTWASKFSATGVSASISKKLLTLSGWAGESYVRVTLVNNANTNALPLRNIEFLSYRPGDQGGAVNGIEENLPLNWNSDKTVVFQPIVATGTAIVAKGFTSQTASIQEWQSSTGSVLMSITPTVLTSSLGSNIFTGDARVGTVTYLNSALSVKARIATEIGSVIQGFTSQSADIQQWQNASGTVLGGVNSLGYGYFGPSYIGGHFSITPASATNRLFVLRGANSQSADLTQWQNFTGINLAKIDASGNLTAQSFIKTDGTSSQILMADGSTTNLNNSSTLDIIPLDDITNEINGQNSRFLPKYQGEKVTINNPLRLLVTINGIIQTVGFTDNTWQSFLPKDGFVVDYDGYIAFSEVPPIGSSFQGRLMAGSDTTSRTTTYPFRASDILLGE